MSKMAGWVQLAGRKYLTERQRRSFASFSPTLLAPASRYRELTTQHTAAGRQGCRYSVQPPCLRQNGNGTCHDSILRRHTAPQTASAQRGLSSSISPEAKARWSEFFWECADEGPDGTELLISQRRRLVDKPQPVEQPRGSLVGKADLTGMRIWEASRVFGKYLRRRQVDHNENFAGLSACELGSGTGTGGLFAACTGMNVVLTDPAKPVNYAKGVPGNTMDVLEHNVERNKDRVKGKVSIQKLLWADSEDIAAVLRSEAAPFDMIIGTDLMYAADNHALLHTILALSHPGTQTLLAYSRRHDGEQRFLDLARHTYAFSVHVDNLTAEGAVDPDATTYRILRLSGRGWLKDGQAPP